MVETDLDEESGVNNGNANGNMDGPARVAKAISICGLEASIERFDDGTSTAIDAAAALKCELGQIVKTLVLLAEKRPTAVLVPGDRQVDMAALARLLGIPRKRLKMVPLEQVLNLTGYPVGGVPPVGLPGQWDVIAEKSLMRFSKVWAAAGAIDALFCTSPEKLLEATQAQLASFGKVGE
ncbi:MAG: hypothetical protein CL897_01075 [Dehalococcoidia bacterium]|nr:hypothetical protein [Dehalococcoidia bacterium]HCV00728.1 hypothetical protein [Dehalococcoidia bacterium]|tara:strand:+ start:2360 stop:2899 length:540 start_codon:yes stop_codon:yes gene_type:complete